MKKFLILSLVTISTIMLTGCGTNSSNKSGNQTGKSSQIESCPNCVFAFYDGAKYYGENGSILTEYTNDYTTLKDKDGKQRKFFLGHILDKDGKIEKGFACGINNEKPFCIEGNKTYKEVISELKKVFGDSNCNEIDSEYTCVGDIAVDLIVDEDDNLNGLELMLMENLDSMKSKCFKVVDIGYHKSSNTYMMLSSDNWCGV